jgi:hypothetical protein
MCIFVSLAKIYDRIFLHCIILSLIHRMKFSLALIEKMELCISWL